MALGLLLGGMPAQAQTIDVADIYVDAGSSAATPTGLSWATAYSDLEAALAAVTPTRTVLWVAEGTYTATTSFSIPTGVTLYGGLVGTEATSFDLDGRDFTANMSTLTTAADAPIVNQSGNQTIVMDGFVISGGAATALSGGGFRQYSSGAGTENSTLRNMVFSANLIPNAGGAIYFGDGDMTLQGVVFTGNSAGSLGGAVYADNAGTLTIENAVFAGNVATSTGGALRLDGAGTTTISHSVFYGNTATDGAISWATTSPAVDGSIFFSNVGFAGTESFIAATVVTYSMFDSTTGTAAATTTNIDSAAPGFTSAVTGDFTLLASSLAINSADPASTVASDIAASDRDDGANDMGAFEMDYELDFGDLPKTQPLYVNVTEVLEDAGAANGNDAARHLISGPYLGASVDAEVDGQTNATTADDEGSDDDGIVFITTVPGTLGNSGSVQVSLGGASSGKLNAWVDFGNDGTFDATDRIFTDEVITSGSAVYTYTTAATGTIANVGARFRLSTAGGDMPGGYAATGEVEDYLVSPTNSLAILVPSGQNATIALDGLDVVVTDASAIELLRTPYGGSLTYNGTTGNDVITIDGDVLRVMDINTDLGLGIDSVIINDVSAGPLTSVTHVFTNENDGTVTVNSANILSYTGLDPIADNMSAMARVFTFPDGDDLTITLSPDGDGASDNNISFIDSGASEEVSFVNPTVSLTINAGDGDDTVVIGSLDTDSGADPAIDIDVNAEEGSDSITVTPSLAASIDVDGGTPATCVGGDLLFFNLGTAIVDNDNGSAVSFSTAHLDLDYFNIESVVLGSAQVELMLSQSTIYTSEVLEDAAGTALVITVTNNTGNPLSCVSAEVPLDIFTNGTVGASPTGILTSLTATDADRYMVSLGSYDPTATDSTWTIGSLADGASATMTIQGVVDDLNPHEYIITAGAAGGDFVQETLVHSVGFQFPAKAHVNAAIYLEREFDAQDGAGGAPISFTEERLIVGLFNGSPGQEGAVWCKVDGLIGTGANRVFPQPELLPAITDALAPDLIGNLWRPCATGLPFPLHVNDFYLDENQAGTDDDILWMAVWGSAGLYKSEDLGETWEAAWPGIGNGSAADGIYWTNVYSITQDNSGFLYISANNGQVFRSFNDGASWQQVADLPRGAADTPWSLLAHPDDAGVLYAGTFGYGVYMTDDWGFTWMEMDDPTTVGTNENEELYDPTGNNAGHIFSMVIDDEDLFLGTANGVWRADLATTGVGDHRPAGSFEFLGPEVVQGSTTYVPEIRALTLVEATDFGSITAGDVTGQDLIAGAWGKFLIDGDLVSAFLIEDPNGAAGGADATEELALRGVEVSFIEASSDGTLFIGTAAGLVTLDASASSTSTASEPVSTELPDTYALEQNYPNPFNPVTTIAFALPETGNVRLAVYDVLGRQVALLASGTLEAGGHEVRFEATNLPSGTYLYRLDTDQGSFTRQLVLMK